MNIQTYPAILPGRYEVRDGRRVEIDPPIPAPELMTEDEAIRYLRLDETRTENPVRTLKYYRDKGLLFATQVGRCVRYRRIELDRLLERLTENNPR